MIQGVPKHMGIQWRIRYRLCYESSIVLPNFKSHDISMSARVYFMKRVKDCQDVSIMSPQDEQWRRRQVYFVCILQFSCFTKYTLAVKT